MIPSAKKWLKNNKLISAGLPVLVSSLLVSAGVSSMRQGGWLQPLELNFYDRMMQLRPESAPDSRLLAVLITEGDIQAEGKWPLSDATLARALGILEKSEPHAIGVDLYRDLPVEPGHEQLSQLFENGDRVIAVCKLESAKLPSVPPPPSLAPEQVGFADIPVDQDGFVRRSLFYIDPQPSKCTTPYSFSLQLSLRYLLAQGVQPQVTESGLLQLGQTVLKPIDSNTGSYQNIDAGGYQLILDYRAAEPAPAVTLAEVLAGEVSPNLIRGKVVLLGVAAPSLKDSFYTPFSNETDTIELMPGVLVHAQMVSQLISAALDGRPLIWSWNQGQEILWIFWWGLLGSSTVLLISRPLVMVSLQLAGSILIGGVSWWLFLQSGWIPLVPPLLSFVGSGLALVLFNAYQAKQEQLIVKKQVEEQEKSIAMLRSLLSQSQTQLEGVPTLPKIQDRKGDVLVGRYQITKGLGKGSFGKTYLARDLQRPGKPYCVVKRLTPASKNPKYLQIARRLFKTEAQILEKVGKHPQIPLLLAYVEENDQFYLIQEYIKGQTLLQEFYEQKKYSERQILGIVEEILSILTFIQKYNLIHRDIKPDNIIRRASDNRLVLIDFGAVKQIQPYNLDKRQGKTVIIGSQGYAPPEQLAGQPVMGSDIYATGMVAIYGLTGIKAGDLEKDSSTGEVIWEPHASVSKATAALLNKMVRYHFNDRYQTAQEALSDLRQLKRNL